MIEKKPSRRKFTGLVISAKMTKTIVVLIERLVLNKKYKKQVHHKSTFKVHDERSEAKPGDKVVIEECRPLSKDKRWRLVSIVK